jgi:hypothetical protein
MKFPAIEERTLGSKHPILTDASAGDIINFYGPCNHDPLGKDEIHAQLLERQHRRARDYNGLTAAAAVKGERVKPLPPREYFLKGNGHRDVNKEATTL